MVGSDEDVRPAMLGLAVVAGRASRCAISARGSAYWAEIPNSYFCGIGTTRCPISRRTKMSADDCNWNGYIGLQHPPIFQTDSQTRLWDNKVHLKKSPKVEDLLQVLKYLNPFQIKSPRVS